MNLNGFRLCMHILPISLRALPDFPRLVELRCTVSRLGGAACAAWPGLEHSLCKLKLEHPSAMPISCCVAAESTERGHGPAGIRGRANGGHHRGGRLVQGLQHPGQRLHTAAGMSPSHSTSPTPQSCRRPSHLSLTPCKTSARTCPLSSLCSVALALPSDVDCSWHPDLRMSRHTNLTSTSEQSPGGLQHTSDYRA